MAIEEITITLRDLEDVRQVLAAAFTYAYASDLQAAQRDFRAVRESPLTMELQRVKDRFDGYLGDHLLQQHEAELAERAALVEDDVDEAENGSQESTEASEELSPAPLGDFKMPRQQGRRLSQDEI